MPDTNDILEGILERLRESCNGEEYFAILDAFSHLDVSDEGTNEEQDMRAVDFLAHLEKNKKILGDDKTLNPAYIFKLKELYKESYPKVSLFFDEIGVRSIDSLAFVKKVFELDCWDYGIVSPGHAGSGYGLQKLLR